MAHSVAEAAARAVKNSQKVKAETRTDIIGDIRKLRAAKLFVTPDDQDYLLRQYDFRGEQIRQFTIARDEAKAQIDELTRRAKVASATQIDTLQAKAEDTHQEMLERDAERKE